MNKKFKIDFFEFSFLVEACIPPRPIARSMFWDEVINEYYHQMTNEERTNLFEWMNKNIIYQQRLKEKNEQVLIFDSRFDPKNQYLVTTIDGEEHETFRIEDKYYVYNYHGSKAKFIDAKLDSDKIKQITKING